MNFDLLIDRVRQLQSGEATGHDWYHTQRVAAVSAKLAEKEGCRRDVVMASAYLHDVADHKFGYTKESRQELLMQLMTEAEFPGELQQQVLEVVESISYSEGVPCREELRKESDIVKDADQLDALGAIGIARTFAYGGAKGRPIYSPETTENSLQHFDDKLLHLADGMRTEAGRGFALARHEFMVQFLEEFKREWNAENIE